MAMNDDDKLAMYEAMAIAVEKQTEINRLNRENEKLLERLRRLELDKNTDGEWCKRKLDLFYRKIHTK